MVFVVAPSIKRIFVFYAVLCGLISRCSYNFTHVHYPIKNLLTFFPYPAIHLLPPTAQVYLVERVGRRRLLSISVFLCALSLISLTIGIQISPDKDLHGHGEKEKPTSTEPHKLNAHSVAIFASVLIFIPSFAVGLGISPSSPPPHFPPLSVAPNS